MRASLSAEAIRDLYAAYGLLPIGGGSGEGESSGGSSGGGESGGQQGQQGGETGAEGEKAGNKEFKPITSQEDLDAIFASRLKRYDAKVRKELADQVKAELQAEADRKANEAKGEFEKLYKDAQTKISELETQLKERDRRELRRTIGTKHKLPDDLIDRLQGETEAELEADAKKLAKVAGAGTDTGNPPDSEGGKGGGRPPKKSNETSKLDRYSFASPTKIVPWDGGKKE